MKQRKRRKSEKNETNVENKGGDSNKWQPLDDVPICNGSVTRLTGERMNGKRWRATKLPDGVVAVGNDFVMFMDNLCEDDLA